MYSALFRIGIKMQNSALWMIVGIIYSVISKVLPIDCYFCHSINGAVQECEDSFVTDISTIHLISRDCNFGYFKAQYCIKLKGTRADGSSILVRQCSMEDYGQHCGLIQFEVGEEYEDVEGCLETCKQDGCNLGTIQTCSPAIVPFLVIVRWLSFICVR